MPGWRHCQAYHQVVVGSSAQGGRRRVAAWPTQSGRRRGDRCVEIHISGSATTTYAESVHISPTSNNGSLAAPFTAPLRRTLHLLPTAVRLG